MNAYLKLQAALSSLLVLLSACATHQARQAIETRQREMTLNTEAWHVARGRLRAMCPEPPKNDEEYQRGKAIVKSGRDDPFGGCDLRLVKLTNALRFDDWQWDWLPSYQTIVQVHEEELRRRVVPKVYEEYMGGLTRHLAEKTDKGDIKPQQLMHTFNEGWKWMFGKMQEEAILLQQNVQTAQQSDAAFWNTLNTLAASMAVVAGAALVAAAAAPRYPAPAVGPTVVSPTPTYQPVNCVARPAGGVIGAGGRTYYTSVHVNCY